MEAGALGGSSEEKCADRHLRAGRASKTGENWSGAESRKMAGTKKNTERFREMLSPSKITLVNFLSVPPLSLSSRESKGFTREIFYSTLLLVNNSWLAPSHYSHILS